MLAVAGEDMGESGDDDWKSLQNDFEEIVKRGPGCPPPGLGDTAGPEGGGTTQSGLCVGGAMTFELLGD